MANKPAAAKAAATKKVTKKTNLRTPAKRLAPKKPKFTLPEARRIGKSYKLKIGELVRIDTDFEHYYYLGKVGWVPALTRVLDIAGPVGFGLRSFWKNNTAEESDQILNKAGDFGSKMHEAFESLLAGVELDLLHDYPMQTEKKVLVAFADWFKTYQPQTINSEKVAGSRRYRYGCTLDFWGELLPPADAKPQTWVVDFKTSNAIHFTHKMQGIAQKHALWESYGVRADVVAILRLGTNHTGSRPAYFQGRPLSGRGWELCVVGKHSMKDFMGIYNTFLAMHDHKIPEPPEVVIYPEKLRIIETIVQKPGVAVVKVKKNFKTGQLVGREDLTVPIKKHSTIKGVSK